MTLVSALAWRVVAELFRWHQRRLDLRVLQAHPGISMRGSLVVTIGCPLNNSTPALCLDLGGPSGTYTVTRRVGSAALRPRVPFSGGFAGPMLTDDPAAVIARIAEAWGLPPVPGQMRTSTPTTLTARVIAGLLERLAFDRSCWRTTAGYCDNSAVGPMVPTWLTALGQDADAIPEALDNSSIEPASRLTRFVLLHRAVSSDGICLRLAQISGSAIAFDLATGEATVLTRRGAGQSFDIPDRYAATRRNMRLLINEFEAVLTS
jgi:hypothetical protein